MSTTKARSARTARSQSFAVLLAMSGAMSAVEPLVNAIGAQQPAVSTKSASKSTPAEAPTYGHRRFKYIGVGAAIGGALAFGYYHLSAKGTRSSNCQPKSCALPYLTITGAISGMFLAHEIDAQRRAETPRAGTTLDFNAREYALPAAPTAIAMADSIVAVVTDSGAQLLQAGPRPAALQRRGAGLSDLRSVGVGGSRLIIGTGSALWETPLSTGLLRRMVDGPVDALGSYNDIVVSASGRTIHVSRARDGVAKLDSLDAGAPVTATSRDSKSGHWWITSDSTLFELNLDGAAPVLVSRAKVDGQLRAIASNERWIAVAVGSNGIALWSRTAFETGGSTTPLTLRGEPRMAFDLAFANGDLFVAAGVDGVYQVVIEPDLRIKGASRQVGYATSILSDGKVLWVADRSRNRVVRMVP